MEEWQEGKTLIECSSYMLKYEVASDVTFSVGPKEEEFRAHRYALMSRSAIFLDTLAPHMETSNIRISLTDVRPDVFREILGYIYTGNIEVNSSNVTDIMFTAKRFAMQGLVTHCFNYLDKEISINNVCKIMEQAHKFSVQILYDKCLKYSLEYAAEVLKTTGFTDLCPDCIRAILKDDELKAEEGTVYEAALNWATHECRRQKLQPNDENRQKVLGDLLYLVRFTAMDVTYFTQQVSKREILPKEEAVAVFQYFHGEQKQLPDKLNHNDRNRLPIKTAPKDDKSATRSVKLRASQADPFSTSRDTPLTTRSDRFNFHNVSTHPVFGQSKSPNYSTVTRFRTYDGQWKQNGPPDAIMFSCSSPIVLYGVEIFGSAKGSETYHLKLYLFDDLKEEILKTEATIETHSIQRTYEVIFPRRVRIPPGRLFTIVLVMKGGPTVKGVDGTSSRVANGVAFDFVNSNRSSNGTDVTVGQIPSLLFHKTE